MGIYFISDFHLGEAEPRQELYKLELFGRFIDFAAADMDRLVIVGDMFDFWFEYRELVPKRHLQVLFRLRELVASGVPVSYVTGNHDLWMGDFLPLELGIDVHQDQLEIDTANGKILVMHGDGLPGSDWKYRLLKQVLRNRLSIALYRLLPPALAYGLARSSSRRSRRHTAKRPPESFLDEYFAYARQKFAEGYFAFVCGHTHQPQVAKIGDNFYVNTGDWITHYSYIRFAGTEFKLGYASATR